VILKGLFGVNPDDFREVLKKILNLWIDVQKLGCR
jgi:hypothetical protein